jgi:hypothetical protein
MGASTDGGLRLRRAGVEWRKVEGEILALDLGSSRYLLVNRTGAILWPALVRGTTRAELVSLLLASHDVDAQAAQCDVEVFVGALVEEDLLEDHP